MKKTKTNKTKQNKNKQNKTKTKTKTNKTKTNKTKTNKTKTNKTNKNKNKQNKKTKHHNRRKWYCKHHSDCTGLAQVGFVMKCWSHQSDYTRRVCCLHHSDCGIGICCISYKYNRIDADIRRQPSLKRIKQNAEMPVECLGDSTSKEVKSHYQWQRW